MSLSVPTLRVAWSLALMGTPVFAAIGQEPVMKPTTPDPAPRTGDRLPAPRNISAVQLADGRIRVTWSPVAEAKSYAIVRSVPPDAAKPITPNVTDTVFIDSDVTAGKTYYYVISGLNDAATGLRQGSAPVKATRSYAPGTVIVAPTPTNVVARYDTASRRVYVSWRGDPAGMTYFVQRRQLPAGSWAEIARVSSPGHSVSSLPPGRWQFQVAAMTGYSAQSPFAVSNEVVVDSSSAAPSLPSGPLSTTGPAGTVSVTIGSAISMRVGATASGGSALGGGNASRWVSLDEAIASVDGSGTVTARTAGRAQILAIGRAADGSVRVTLVQVTVSP